MIIGIVVRLEDGRTVSIMPSAVIAVEDHGGEIVGGVVVAPYPVLVLSDGTRYRCAPIPDVPAGMPQSVALVNAINGALEKIAHRLDTRQRIAGLP